MTEEEFYLEQMERMAGALARKFSDETLKSWWSDGVVKYRYERYDIEYAAGEIGKGDDKFPTLSNFIYHCGAGRRKRKEGAALKLRQQEAQARDLSPDGIFAKGLERTKNPKTRAVIETGLSFLRGDIDREALEKRVNEIEKGKL